MEMLSLLHFFYRPIAEELHAGVPETVGGRDGSYNEVARRADPMPTLVLHYNEIWLKGCNRNFFVAKLREHVRLLLADIPPEAQFHEENRILITYAAETDARRAAQRLQSAPGISYIGLGVERNPEMEAIVDSGVERMREASFRTFRVRARRSDKLLPFRSSDIERELGARILADARERGRDIRVDLKHAEATCHVEVNSQRALIYSEKLPGIGGLPPGTAGKLTCLLSGGYDSAVAAYKILRRGVSLSFVHFHGRPAKPGEDSPPIARELVRKLTPYQGRSRLYLAPFDDIQKQIVAAAPEEFRILLYRRLMLRIAERVARREHAHGLVTGDSISQVASQTLHNMEAVNAVARLPVYRPLVGDDKHDILAIARRIGTFDISSEPFTDCCPMYLPKNPRIFTKVRELDEAEARLDIDALVSQGVKNLVKETYLYDKGRVVQRRPSEQPSPPATPIAVAG